jgi:hypothetical protein
LLPKKASVLKEPVITRLKPPEALLGEEDPGEVTAPKLSEEKTKIAK